MSSDSNGRYKSRLFNFLDARFREVAEKSDLAVRHLKIATIWGVQLMVYPIYALFQTARLAGKQLQQAVKKGLKQLQEGTDSEHPGLLPDPDSDTGSEIPSADTPIQQVLSAVESLSLPEVGARRLVAPASVPSLFEGGRGGSKKKVQVGKYLPSSVLPHSFDILARTKQVVIQGVATLVATRSLVLVTEQNEIHDVLTREQQQKLSRRIIWEVADYWRERRVFESADRQVTAGLPSPDTQAKLLPPVRMFRQLMSWVQKGQIAIAVNLFQESSLVVQPRAISVKSPTPLLLKQPHPITTPTPNPKFKIADLLQGSALTVLDSTVANLEAGRLGSVEELTTSLVRASKSALQRFQAIVSSPLVDTDWQQEPPVVREQGVPKLSVEALIRAAIDYFFGQPDSSLPGETGADELLDGGTTLPLKGDAQGKVSLPLLSPKGKQGRVLRLGRGGGTPPLQVSAKGGGGTAPLQAAPLAVAASDTTAVPHEYHPTLSPFGDGERESVCIEAEVTSVGYVKHPLEQLLEWLDRVMVRVEAIALQVWQWLREERRGD